MTKYAVKKKHQWLMGYIYTGLKETINGQEPQDIPVCLWSEISKDALLFDERGTAKYIADVSGAAVVRLDLPDAGGDAL